MANGNGFNFDFSDQTEVNAYMYRTMSVLLERTEGLAELKEEHASMRVEVDDLRDDAKWQDKKQWIHSIVVLVLTTLKSLVFHGKI